MINFFKSDGSGLKRIDKKEPGCWVSVQSPTDKEVKYLKNELGIHPELIETSLDENEKSHIEAKDGKTVIVFDMPVEIPINIEEVPGFYTMPIGFIFLDDCVVSILSMDSPIIKEIEKGAIDEMDTTDKPHLVLSIIYHISSHFVMHLENIDNIVFKVELQLHKTMKNRELIEILGLQKSLVYFSSSLKSTEATLLKLKRGRAIELEEEDKELLEDALIEIQQSIENVHIYTEVLASTIDTISSIITNNVNDFMKVLTSITIVLSIPNMIFGFYGMNVTFHDSNISFLLPLAITAIVAGACAWILYKNNFFN